MSTVLAPVSIDNILELKVQEARQHEQTLQSSGCAVGRDKIRSRGWEQASQSTPPLILCSAKQSDDAEAMCLYDENNDDAKFLETLALYRRVGASATLDALLEGLRSRSRGSLDFGQPKKTRWDTKMLWDHEEYRSTDGIKALYDAAHVDPFSFRSDFFRSLKPRDVARLNDFWVALGTEPYSKLLTGVSKPETVSELRDGDDRYMRRVKIDDMFYTFNLARRAGKWGVEWILAEPVSGV